MRDLIITENISLDGVIDASEGWFAPAGEDEVDQSDLIAALKAQSDAADALLVGRRTFEQLRGSSTSTACSSTPWCSAAGSGCSPMGPACRSCASCRRSRSARASSCFATGLADRDG